MLTSTETVQRNLTATEKIDMDINLVIDNYKEAMNTQDKTLAVAYAKVLMLKAMTLAWMIPALLLYNSTQFS